MCNLPVIATPSGDIADLLEGVVPSYLCSADAEELGAALAHLLAEPVRSNGRTRAESTLSASVVASRLLEIYADRMTGDQQVAFATAQG